MLCNDGKRKFQMGAVQIQQRKFCFHIKYMYQQMKGKKLWKVLALESSSPKQDFHDEFSPKHQEYSSLDFMMKRIGNSNKKVPPDDLENPQDVELQYSQVICEKDLKRVFYSEKEQHQQPMIMSVDTRTYTIQSPSMEKWLEIKNQLSRLKIFQQDCSLFLLKQSLRYHEMMEQIKKEMGDMLIRVWQDGKQRQNQLRKVTEESQLKDARIEELQQQRKNQIEFSDIIETLQKDKAKIHDEYEQQIHALEQTIEKLIVEKDGLNEIIFDYEQKVAQIQIQVSEKVKLSSQRKIQKTQKKYVQKITALEEEIESLHAELFTKTKEKQIYEVNYKFQLEKLNAKQQQVREKEIQLEKQLEEFNQTHQRLKQEQQMLRKKRQQLAIHQQNIGQAMEQLKHWEKQMQQMRGSQTYRQSQQIPIRQSFSKQQMSSVLRQSVEQSKLRYKVQARHVPTAQSVFLNAGKMNPSSLPPKPRYSRKRFEESQSQPKYSTSILFTKKPSEKSKLLNLNSKLSRLQKQIREEIDSIK